MKRILFFLGLISTISVYSQPPVTATFEVDLSLYQGAYSTVEFYRGGQLYSMANTIGNTYEYTTTVPGFQASNYSYKFVVDGVAETFYGTESCVGIIASDTLRIINLNTTTAAIVCWESCNACATAIPGCTDPTANNYAPTSNIDDGSCEYNITFFIDMTHVTDTYITPEVNGDFNAWCGNCASMTDANNDSIWEIIIPLTTGSYIYKFSADNWNIEESLYEFDDCVSGNPPYINRSLVVNANQVLDTVCWNRCYGCDTERNFYNVTFQVDVSNVTSAYTAPEVNGTFNNWCGNCWVLDPQGNNIYSRSFNVDTFLHTFKFSADNWNIQENLDSALSCVALGFDSLGVLEFVNRELKLISDTIIDVCWESCSACIPIVYGCTDSLACNYDPLATFDNGSCLTIYGCTDTTACNYDNLSTCDDGSCLTLFGCTDILSCNYASLATCDDGSCLTLYGCMNPSAINYDSLANCPDSCIFPQVTYGCTDSTAVNYNPIATIDDSSCIYCVYGCIDILACNYDSLATCDDGSCLTIYGCTDSLACNYDSLATCDDGSCLTIYGCTDSLACNYDSLATCDNGSCLIMYGCMDSLAFNYDSLANCNDSASCLYEYNVTFQLDLREQIGIAYTTPEVNGLFNGWCGNCAEMTDINNDSIWELTVPILEGSGPALGVPGWEYKFSADNWNIQESLFSGDPCTFSAFGYTNRYINVTQDTILDPVCWQSCNDCYGPQTAFNITFRLDMSQYIGIPFSAPEINGTFNAWCGSCWPMTDIDGDNIWEFTTLIDSSRKEYKFSTDNWSLQELLDSSLYCVTSTIDSSGNVFVNRELKIYSDTILNISCWNECDSCTSLPNSVLNINDKNLSIYPNPSNGLFYIKSNDLFDKIVVYDILHKKLFEVSNPELVIEIDLSNKNANILLIETHRDGKVSREKLIIIK